MEEQVLNSAIEEVGKKGLLTVENGIRVFAVIGAAALMVATVKAFRNAWANHKNKPTATDEKGNDIKVDLETPDTNVA